MLPIVEDPLSSTDTGVLARREYDAPRLDRSKASLVFSLMAPQDRTEDRWTFARDLDADAFGLIEVHGIEGAPRLPILWAFNSPDEIALAVSGEDADTSIPIDLQLLIDHYMPQFFSEAVEPELIRLITSA